MTNRLGSLDGLRGILALLVVVSHITPFLPIGDWSIGSGPFGHLLSAVADFPFSSGRFSVFVFFTISGVVIAGAAIGNRRWPLTLVSRYFRLSVPMVVAALASWSLLQAFPGELKAVADLVAPFHRNNWTAGLMDNPVPSFFAAAREGFWSAYLYPDPYFDPVLWSMKTELFGSLGIYTLYFFTPERFRTLVLLAWFGVLFLADKTVFLGFPLGALIYEFNERRTISFANRWSWMAILFGAALALFMEMPEGRYAGLKLTHPVPGGTLLQNVVFAAAGALIVIGAMGGRSAGGALTLRVPRFLGRISYSLYLLHQPILFTMFIALYRWAGCAASDLAQLAWVGAFFAFIFTASWLMTRFIDEPVTRFVKVRRKTLAVPAGLPTQAIALTTS